MEDRLAEELAVTTIEEAAHLKEGIEGMDREAMAAAGIMRTAVVTGSMVAAEVEADTKTDEEDTKTEAEVVEDMVDMTTSVVVAEEVDVETSVEIVVEDTGEIEIARRDQLKTNSVT